MSADVGVGSTAVGVDGRLLGIKFANGWYGVTGTTTLYNHSYGPKVELTLHEMSIDSILSVEGTRLNVVHNPPKVGDTVTKENWREIPIDSVLAIGCNRAHVASSLSAPSGKRAVMHGSVSLSRDNCIGGIIEYIPS